MSIRQELVTVENPSEYNLIFGQSHFIKTVEDVYEALIQSAPGIKFGVAFCEASGDRLIRFDGNDEEMKSLAVKNAQRIGCGHTFIIFMKDAYPINVMHILRTVPEIVRLFAATANPLQVVVFETEQGRGVGGVIDGQPPLGVETEKDQEDRMQLLRRFGYKRH